MDHTSDLFRRCIDDASVKSYYLVSAPPETTLQEMVLAIGARWHIEEDLEATKDLGLDQYEVRSYTGWYRHVTLVMLAYAFLVSIRVHDKSHLPASVPRENAVLTQPVIRITTSEVRHLLALLFFPPPSSGTRVLAWSIWRRRHQYRASQCHTNARLKAG